MGTRRIRVSDASITGAGRLHYHRRTDLILTRIQLTWSGRVLLPARRGTCTSAGCARPSSTGCMPGGTAGSSFFALTTPTSSGTGKRRWGPFCGPFGGSACTGTKVLKSVGRTPRTFNRSAASGTAPRPRSSKRGAWPIAITRAKTRSTPTASRPRATNDRTSTSAGRWSSPTNRSASSTRRDGHGSCGCWSRATARCGSTT